MASGDINLLRTKTALSPELLDLQKQIASIGYGALGVTIVVAFIIGGALFFLSQQKQSLTNKKQQLLSSIAANATKESLYVILKDRIPMVDRVRKSQINWGAVMEYIPAIASPPKLKSINVEEQKVVVLSIRTDTIEEASQVVGAVQGLYRSKRIRSPQLVGLQVINTGAVQLNISFIPI